MTQDRDAVDEDRGRMGLGGDARYWNLPHTTRAMLENLHPDDAENLTDLLASVRQIGPRQFETNMEMIQTFATLGRFAKWGVVALVAIFGGVATIGTAVIAIAGWFHGGTKL
jgi:hypothetical protein